MLLWPDAKTVAAVNTWLSPSAKVEWIAAALVLLENDNPNMQYSGVFILKNLAEHLGVAHVMSKPFSPLAKAQLVALSLSAMQPESVRSHVNELLRWPLPVKVTVSPPGEEGAGNPYATSQVFGDGPAPDEKEAKVYFG